MVDAHRLALLLPLAKHRWWPPGDDGKMVRGRAQILADRDDVAIDGGEVGHGLDDLGIGLAHADDDRRLGDEPRCAARARTDIDRGYDADGRTARWSRATVSML